MGLFNRLTKKDNLPTADATSDPSADSPASSNAPQSGLLARFRRGLKRTSDLLNTDIRDLFKQEGQLVDEQLLDRLYALLVRTDMGSDRRSRSATRLQQEFRGRVVQMDDVLNHVQRNVARTDAAGRGPLAAGRPRARP